MLGFPFIVRSWYGGWGWLATIGSLIGLGIALIPWFFFLLNLANLLERVDVRRRAMPPSYVWLNFIPVFNLGWFIYTVVKVRDSVKAEYAARGWAPDKDFGYSVGMAAALLLVASSFLGWIPLFGWILPIVGLVCWILYWLKTSELKGVLAGAYSWQPVVPPPTPPVPGGAGGDYGATSTKPPTRFCAVCGNPYDVGDKFCRTCGMKLPPTN